MKVSIKAYCKKSQVRADQLAPLYIQIKWPYQKEKLLSTGKYIDPENFNNKSGYYDNGNQGINKFIREEITRVESIIDDLKKNQQDGELESIKYQYYHRSASNSFFKFVDLEMIELQKSKHLPTYNDYRVSLVSLRRYSPNISFNDITTSFLEEFRDYLIHKEYRKPNGVYHDLAAIRMIFNRALKKKLVSHYPFSEFTMPKENVQPEFLTMEELNRLFDLWQSKTLSLRLQATAFYFLLSCFTSLRYADVFSFSKRLVNEPEFAKHIIQDGYILVKLSKSRFKKQTKMPLHVKLKQLLENPPDRQLKLSSHKITTDLTNLLKEINVSRHLTFHSSRHTFGVVSLQLGLPREVVQEVMQHSSMVTTQKYTKIVNDLVNKEVSKWDLL